MFNLQDGLLHYLTNNLLTEEWQFYLINIGFMVFEPQLLDYIDNDTIVFEKEPMNALVEQGELMAYTHKGFWQCMDTLREKQKLDSLLEKGEAPWKLWE